eukprot:8034574-Alexandrium_andersonii.AAC.1
MSDKCTHSSACEPVWSAVLLGARFSRDPTIASRAYCLQVACNQTAKKRAKQKGPTTEVRRKLWATKLRDIGTLGPEANKP